jgi:hypothetical protein
MRAPRKAAMQPSEVLIERAQTGPNVTQVRNRESREGTDQRVEEARSAATKSGARKRADHRKDDTHDWIHRRLSL